MCVICIDNFNFNLSKNEVDKMLNSNRDGSSIFYNTKKGIVIKKYIGDNNNTDTIYNDYLQATTTTTSPIILHFRIGTSGDNNLDNVHPFKIGKNIYFCLNGINHLFSLEYKNKSDTNIIAYLLYGKSFEFQDIFLKKLAIVDGVKIALLKSNELFTYGDFYEKNGLLFSNMYWDFDMQKLNNDSFWCKDYQDMYYEDINCDNYFDNNFWLKR